MKISNMLVLKSSDVSSCKFQHLASVDSSNPLPLCDNRKERQREHKIHCNNDWNSGLCMLFFPCFHIFCNTVNGQLCHIRRIICGTDLTERPTAYTHTHKQKTHTRKHAQTRARAHKRTRTNTRAPHTHAQARTNTRAPHTHKQTNNTHTQARTRTHKRARAHKHARTKHAHTHTHCSVELETLCLLTEFINKIWTGILNLFLFK